MNTIVKKQSKKVGVAGSFVNQLMGNNSSEPKVGEGATVLMYSDRHPYKVIEVSEDGMSCKLQAFEAVYAGEPGKAAIGHQNWKFVPTERFMRLTWRKNSWCQVGQQISYLPKFVKAFEAENKKEFRAYYLPAELREKVYGGEAYPQNVVDNVTKARTTYTPISIIFGHMDYYYDWSF